MTANRTVEHAPFLLLDDACGLELAQFRLRVTQKVPVDFAIVLADARRRLIETGCRTGEHDRKTGPIDVRIWRPRMPQADCFSAGDHPRVSHRFRRTAHLSGRDASPRQDPDDIRGLTHRSEFADDTIHFGDVLERGRRES